MAGRVYTKDEADAILARAIELQGRGEAASHTELLATAREIGVAPEMLEKAASEVLAGRRDDEALRALLAGRWRGFFAHLVPFACVGALLGFINVVTGGFPWAVIPMLAWGVGLASHLFWVAVPDKEALRLRVARQRAAEQAGGPEASMRVRARSSEHGSRRVQVRVEQEPGAGRAGEAAAVNEEDESGIETSQRAARRR
jgi:hypothetical protein